MPLTFFPPKHFDPLRAEESDNLIAISSARVRLTDSGWREARESLQRSENLTGVLLFQGCDLQSQLVAESWAELPSRLASLATRPPTSACLVTRVNDITRRAMHSAGDANVTPLWRYLVELSKRHASIEPQTASTGRRLVELVNSSLDVDEDWLPPILQSPPHRELDWIFGEIKLARPSDLCGNEVSLPDSPAVFAGLWLLHGDAAESHRYSQSIEDEGRHRCGNFWHAIMHRQEPDYGNSKYWFRRVGQHPICPELARRADELITADGSESARRWRVKLGAPNGWNASAFVDWCEAAAREADARQINLIRRIQFVEMHLLLRASFEDATQK